MNKRHIITIAGKLGSGKSTTARLVAEKLAYPHHSGGDFMRAMATTRGMTLKELGAQAETDETIDTQIDQAQKEFIDSHDSFVIDSRLGWFFAPDSFKVFLTLPNDVASSRVFADWQRSVANRISDTSIIPKTLEDVEMNLEKRLRSERERYRKYYGIEDQEDSSHFDLVVDTEKNDPETVANLIVEGFKNWLNQ